MATFEVGEIAIFWRPGSKYHMREVEILTPLLPVHFMDTITGLWQTELAYRIADQLLLGAYPGIDFCATPMHLRKRRPPQDWNTLCNLDEAPLDVRAKTPEPA